MNGLFSGSVLLSGEEKSVFAELWDYIVTKYLTPDYGYYENIKIDTHPLITPAAIFFAVLIAILLGCAANIFIKRVLGRLVRRLISREAYTHKKALTLSELELSDGFFIKRFINGLTLSKAVRCREEDEFYGIKSPDPALYDENGKPYWLTDGEEKTGDDADETSVREDAYRASLGAKVKYRRRPLEDHFYIDPAYRHRALVRFDNKGTNPISLVVIALVYIVFGLLVIHFIPDVLAFVDNLIGGVK